MRQAQVRRRRNRWRAEQCGLRVNAEERGDPATRQIAPTTAELGFRFAPVSTRKHVQQVGFVFQILNRLNQSQHARRHPRAGRFFHGRWPKEVIGAGSGPHPQAAKAARTSSPVVSFAGDEVPRRWQLRSVRECRAWWWTSWTTSSPASLSDSNPGIVNRFVVAVVPWRTAETRRWWWWWQVVVFRQQRRSAVGECGTTASSVASPSFRRRRALSPASSLLKPQRRQSLGMSAEVHDGCRRGLDEVSRRIMASWSRLNPRRRRVLPRSVTCARWLGVWCVDSHQRRNIFPTRPRFAKLMIGDEVSGVSTLSPNANRVPTFMSSMTPDAAVPAR